MKDKRRKGRAKMITGNGIHTEEGHVENNELKRWKYTSLPIKPATGPPSRQSLLNTTLTSRKGDNPLQSQRKCQAYPPPLTLGQRQQSRGLVTIQVDIITGAESRQRTFKKPILALSICVTRWTKVFSVPDEIFYWREHPVKHSY